MSGAKSPLYDAGNHRPFERGCYHPAVRLSDLTNPAQIGEGGDQAKLVRPRGGRDHS